MRKYSMETIVGIFVVVGIACIGYLAVKLGRLPILHDNHYTLFARFTSVGGLRVGSPVQVFGIEVGSVINMGIDNERQVAWIAMKIRKDVQIFDDAMATIKTMGLIGDKFIKIDPGGAGPPLKSGDTVTNTVASPDIEDLLGKYIFGQVGSGGAGGGKKE